MGHLISKKLVFASMALISTVVLMIIRAISVEDGMRSIRTISLVYLGVQGVIDAAGKEDGSLISRIVGAIFGKKKTGGEG